MKKRIRMFIGILLILFIKVLLIPEVSSVITSEAITGKITEQAISMNISVVVLSPMVSLLSPENKTYLTNELLLNYSATSYVSVWYNLDNLENITISSPIYINLSEGSHTLYLFVNNSQGLESSTSTVFSVNLTKLLIVYSEYNSSTKGESTNFLEYSYEDLQTLSNIILENTHYGKISFNQIVNLTNDLNPNDNLIDLDSNTEIFQNKIEINSTALPNFNKPATLELYDLDFDNPQILKNGLLCPANICTLEDYSAGILRFNVTEFSIYSAQETPGGGSSSNPGRGGGGGKINSEKFLINHDKIRVSLRQGENKYETFLIENPGNEKITININSTLPEFIKIDEKEITLSPGESREIDVSFLAREDTVAELYMGKIIFYSNEIQKEILVAIVVTTKSPLFDLKIKVTDKSLYINPGEDLSSEIELYNLGNIGKVDVYLEYQIKDENGKVVVSQQETRALETTLSFIKNFRIPLSAKPGEYIVYVKITYNGETAIASDWFTVDRGDKTEYPLLGPELRFILINSFIIALLFIILIVLILKKKKLVKKNN